MPVLDSTDRAIIALLIEDGRMPSTEIARRIGPISTKTVTNRIARLTSEGILRISAIANLKALGYEITAAVRVEAEPGLVKEVGQALAQIEQVV